MNLSSKLRKRTKMRSLAEHFDPTLVDLTRIAHKNGKAKVIFFHGKVEGSALKGPRTVSYSICPNFDSLWLG